MSTGLKHILLGKDHVVILGRGECTDTNIVIPETINGLPVYAINSHAFAKDERLESIEFPSTINHIGTAAFRGCPNLKTVVFAPEILFVNRGSFAECPSLTTIQLGSIKQLDWFKNECFWNSNNIEEIKIRKK